VHWHFEDAQITQYLQAFTKELNIPVVEETLENNNYNPLLEAKFSAGETFDMCYANGYEVPRLLKLGYLQDVESMTDIDKIKSEMYQSIIASESTVDGKLHGLNYYWSARPVPVVNDDVLNKAGLNGQRPGTWAELWSMAAQVKKTGVVQYPVIPNWFSANYGIGWDFLGEMGNTYNDPDCTKTLFAKDFHAVFDTNTEAADLLTTWATSTANGLVDPAVFSMAGESDVVAAGNTGKYAFTTTALYDFETMNDPASSKIPVGMANLVPVTKQGWGMIETGIYCWPKKNHDPVKSQQLIKFLGWKDPATGKRVTSPTWA
jgi:ABC-type glycerol-3-phosphate transport system substrate-binding protein